MFYYNNIFNLNYSWQPTNFVYEHNWKLLCLFVWQGNPLSNSFDKSNIYQKSKYKNLTKMERFLKILIHLSLILTSLKNLTFFGHGRHSVSTIKLPRTPFFQQGSAVAKKAVFAADRYYPENSLFHLRIC